MLKAASFVSSFITGLRFRLLLLVIVACIPLVLLTLNTAWEDRRQARAEWQETTDKLARLTTVEEHRIISITRQMLIALAESAPVMSLNPRACQSLMTKVFESYPQYSNIGLLSTNGENIASATPLSPNYNHSRLNYFKRVLQTGRFSTGSIPPVPGAKTPAVHFGCPVIDPGGTVQAVLFVTLEYDWTRFESEIPAQVPKGAMWSYVNHSGDIVRSFSSDKSSFNPDLPAGSTLSLLFDRAGAFLEADNSKGIPTIYASALIPSQLFGEDFAGVLTIPRQLLFLEADQTLTKSLSWLGVAACLALALGWIGSSLLVLEPVKALVKSSARLAAGDLSARTGLAHSRDELGQLTRAFDQMAQVIEQRQNEQQRTTNKLQLLSKRLVEVQETERRAIARELHDEIGQSLTAAEINLQAALHHTELTPAAPRLRASLEMLQRVLEQVHDLSLNLRPSMLDDLGLEPALRWYTNRQSELTGVLTEFSADPMEERLDTVIETECFRIAQEALTNVARHSKACAVQVNLTRSNGHLQLSVRDNGNGFDVGTKREQAVRGSSLGLISMSERASLAGGGLQIESSPGAGTEVRAWFPLRWRNPKLTEFNE